MKEKIKGIRVWFANLLKEGAQSLVDKMIIGNSGSRSFTDKELEMIKLGIEKGIIAAEGNKFILFHQPGRYYDAFTLNREYFTQFAVLVELIERYGYKIEDCQFEYHLMDICVLKNDKPYIYIETKVNDSGARKLIGEIKEKYSKNIKEFKDLPDRGNDPLRKSKCIFSDKPEFLKIVTPNNFFTFSLEHNESGFNLNSIDDIPRAQ